MEAKKTYVLTVSETFPSYHKRKGENTNFVQLINEGKKIHTIRGNYKLWKKRASVINSGKAILSIRVWTGKPYQSKQREAAIRTKIEVQRIQFDRLLGIFIDEYDSDIQLDDLAKNDGLSLSDFKEWFKETPLDEGLAIIHFTDFKYPNNFSSL